MAIFRHVPRSPSKFVAITFFSKKVIVFCCITGRPLIYRVFKIASSIVLILIDAETLKTLFNYSSLRHSLINASSLIIYYSLTISKKYCFFFKRNKKHRNFLKRSFVAYPIRRRGIRSAGCPGKFTKVPRMRAVTNLTYECTHKFKNADSVSQRASDSFHVTLEHQITNNYPF